MEWTKLKSKLPGKTNICLLRLRQQPQAKPKKSL